MNRLRALSLMLLVSRLRANDPYRASDLWQPTGANAGNLATMAARPRDLLVGRGRDASRTVSSKADAVERVWQGRCSALINPTASSAAATANSGRGAN